MSHIPGSGAAGAASSGILAFLDAEIVSGIDTILDIIDFDNIIKDSTYVVTGEGKLDSQSFDGKLISGVLKHTKKLSIPTICICGISEIKDNDDFYRIYQTSELRQDFEYIKEHAEELYRSAVRKCLNNLK